MNSNDYIKAMEKLLDDLHTDLKELNVNYKAHASIEKIIQHYKQRASEIKDNVDSKS